MRRVVSVLALVALLAVGCGSDEQKVASKRVEATPSPTVAAPKAVAKPTAPPPAPPVKALQAFANCDEVTQVLRKEAIDRVGPWGLEGGIRGIVTASAMGTASISAAGSARSIPDAPFQGEHSKTNVQEEGVDEPDIAETDGRRIFSVPDGRNLRSVVVEGGRPRLADTVTLPGTDFQLLLHGDRLMALGQEHGDRPRTLIMVIDVTDPAALRITARVHLDGSYVSARSVNGIARVVTRQESPPIEYVQPKTYSKAGRAEAIKRNQALLAKVTSADWLPDYKLEDFELPNGVKTGTIAPCERSYRPAEFSGFGTVSVVTIDPNNPQPTDGATVMGGAEDIYASQSALYVTTGRLPKPPTLDQRISGTPPARVGPPLTAIHKFDITDPVQARYVASGTVTGSIHNQFSISEHDRHLRVATTIADTRVGRVRTGAASSVIVLKQEGDKLAEVGRVDGLGAGEQIFSVRFMGPVGYVVTFRRIDPLYVVDLSDPTNPRVSGELKIPGYSAYLHPAGDGLLIGVGQDATDEGIITGAQVSLFDVSDPAAPKRLHQLKLGGTESEVEWDHHAFLWWAQRDLAVLPMWAWDEKSEEVFNGAVAITIDAEDGIKQSARIAHPQRNPHESWKQAMRRSIVIDDHLFTISRSGVMSSNIETFAERGWAAFSS